MAALRSRAAFVPTEEVSQLLTRYTLHTAVAKIREQNVARLGWLVEIEINVWKKEESLLYFICKWKWCMKAVHK